MDVLASVLTTFDATWDQLRDRLAGLDDDEYVWEPAPGCWNVRPSDDGPVVDWAEPDPDPAPVTTIAWRMWHIAVDALDGYSQRTFGATGTGLDGRRWVMSADEGIALLGRAVETFRSGMADLGEEGLARPLGPDWGRFADSTHLDLFLHAHRETTHHGAEIGVLRDLYRASKQPA